jgi:hypothetical protein
MPMHVYYTLNQLETDPYDTGRAANYLFQAAFTSVMQYRGLNRWMFDTSNVLIGA